MSAAPTPSPTLSVVVATVGRPTLLATLESLHQLSPDDELLLVTDGDHPEAFAMLDSAGLSCRTQRIVHRLPANDFGHRLRNLYASRATGDRVLHLDDDDVYLDGALGRVRGECARHPGKLVVFRMVGPRGTFPRARRMSVGNVGTPCGALPNEPAKWGWWDPGLGGDGAFYQTCKFDVAWCDDVICALNPDRWDAPPEAKVFIRPACRIAAGGGIPHAFHRIWLGGGPMPDEFVRYGKSWLRLNPGWEMRTWTDDTLPEIVNRAEFDRFGDNLSGKTDVLRYELLWRFGGVYLDTDFEALKPLGDLFDGLNHFAADEAPGVPGTAILGSAPESALYRHLVEALPASVREHSNYLEQSGPPFLAREIDRYFGADRLRRNLGPVWEHLSRDCSRHLYLFEGPYFYPYGHWEKHRRGEKFADAYGAHHWAHSWRGPA
jgi:glycosyltransferase involved in cell wall biosynthesis